MLGFDVEVTSRKIPNSVNVKDIGGVCAGFQAYTCEFPLFRLLGVLFFS